MNEPEFFVLFKAVYAETLSVHAPELVVIR